jgi:hypothetical protein
MLSTGHQKSENILQVNQTGRAKALLSAKILAFTSDQGALICSTGKKLMVFEQ